MPTLIHNLYQKFVLRTTMQRKTTPTLETSKLITEYIPQNTFRYGCIQSYVSYVINQIAI